MNIRTRIIETKWGGMSLVSLYLSVLSGVLVSLQYDPATPFFSASSLDLLTPFGQFFRSCHFYSSQMFFLLSLCHLAAVILAKTDQQLRFGKWLLLVGSVPAAMLLLFTGYVLRADATGEAAGVIAENITLSIPYLGTLLNSLLFAIEAEGMKRVYANHLIGLGVVWGVCCWDHLRRYRIGFGQHSLLLFGTVLFSLFLAAPMEPARLGLFHIQGPWFLLGLQELLRYVQPFWAGVIFPSTVLVALVCVGTEGKGRRRSLLFIAGWLTVYLILTFVATLR
ncbi:MAG: cytochrome b N-terminal domain-containing protein [Proteobacteria bacterium]|nr:cytochrome b N-terminal domain-containing protein [Pseudomonadota bacterium]MBU4117464.1 cytochrome b N-terminal domain-containing protein [Pseudomonadota bacterium]